MKLWIFTHKLNNRDRRKDDNSSPDESDKSIIYKSYIRDHSHTGAWKSLSHSVVKGLLNFIGKIAEAELV